MTGHGRGEARLGGFFVTVECFSVNRKQAEVTLSAPRELVGLEPQIREAVLARVARGRVTVSVDVSGSDLSASRLDHAAAKAYCEELRRLMRELDLPGEPALASVLEGPGVRRSDGRGTDLWPAVSRALQTALDGLLAMRGKEGRSLQQALKKDLRRLLRLTRSVRPLASKMPARLKQSLIERIARAKLPMDAADPRVAAEAALLAERCDVTEELARLDSHAAQFEEALGAGGAVGRKLEFLAQEMGREWNTIGSKAQSAEISRFVVEAKAALDKLREQLANIE